MVNISQILAGMVTAIRAGYSLRIWKLRPHWARSNYAVGVYMAGAGYSYDATIAICTTVANLISSNADANTQAPWWTRGWNDATNDAGPLLRSRQN